MCVIAKRKSIGRDKREKRENIARVFPLSGHYNNRLYNTIHEFVKCVGRFNFLGHSRKPRWMKH